MKAIIMDIKNGFAAALSDDGCITKVKSINFQIGQEIEIANKVIPFTRKFAMRAASIAAVFIIGGTTTWAYATPYSYVSLDVNPSIEYSVNIFDRVIGVSAINDDGQDILDKINLHSINHLSIEEAISKTVQLISDNGYFNNETTTDSDGSTDTEADIDADIDTSPNNIIDNSAEIDGGIVISTSSKSKKKAEKLAKALEASVEAQIDESGDTIVFEVVSVDQERVQRAKELGITPGKLELIEKLQRSVENPEDIVIEEWIDKSVKEIMKETNENEKASQESKQKDSKESNQKDPKESNQMDPKGSDTSGDDIDAKPQQFNADDHFFQPELNRNDNKIEPTIGADNNSSNNNDRIKNKLTKQEVISNADKSSQHDNNNASKQQSNHEESTDAADPTQGVQDYNNTSPNIDENNIVSEWKTSNEIKQAELKVQEQIEQNADQTAKQDSDYKAEWKSEQNLAQKIEHKSEQESEQKAVQKEVQEAVQKEEKEQSEE